MFELTRIEAAAIAKYMEGSVKMAKELSGSNQLMVQVNGNDVNLFDAFDSLLEYAGLHSKIDEDSPVDKTVAVRSNANLYGQRVQIVRIVREVLHIGLREALDVVNKGLNEYLNVFSIKLTERQAGKFKKFADEGNYGWQVEIK